jgi:menaquinone-dependent protoporphyrinogen oxidase
VLPLNDMKVAERLPSQPSHAREHRVFFGVYQPGQKPVGFAERFMSFMPAAKKGLPAGDFRNWPEIEAWAGVIVDDPRKGVVPSAT